jgi:hypothetical protein
LMPSSRRPSFPAGQFPILAVGANSRCGAMSDVATTRLPRTVHRLRGVDGEAVLRAPGT